MIATVQLRRLFVGVAVATSLLVTVPHVKAGSGSAVALPLPGTKVTTGLRLEVDTDWVDGTGYRPVRLRISPIGGGAAPADRMVRVELTPHSWRWATSSVTVSTWIELSQGSTFAEKTVPVPQTDGWGSIAVKVTEDGEECEDLSDSFGIASNYQMGWTEAAPVMLFLDSDTPLGDRSVRFQNLPKTKTIPQQLSDIRAISTLFTPKESLNGLDADDFDLTQPADDNDMLQIAFQLPRLAFCRPSELPTDWVALTSVDMMFISLTDLRQLARDAARWESLSLWLSAGPTLCVYDVGTGFERIGEVEQLFGIRSEPRDSDPTKRGWMAPHVRDYVDEVHATRNMNWSNQWYSQPVPAAARNKPAKPAGPPDHPRPFLIHGVQKGRVVALSDPFPGKRADWCWLFNTIESRDWMWYQRHGLSFHRQNREYWNLLIPGVGDAPVTSFLVLISLFVVVIGPVNYYMLHRRHRLYLLLVTVPLGAGAITFALMSYAVVNDGLGVRLRARSLTTIDQANGRSVTWSRQSYYAGLAPSAGMTFPKEAAVYPMVHRPRGPYGRPQDFRREINWDEEQNMKRGYLNSRSTAQMIVIEPRPTDARLIVQEPPVSTSTAFVTNRLGVTIQGLLLCDTAGRPLGCGRLPDGMSVQTYHIDAAAFPKQWSGLFSANRPAYPLGFDPDDIDNASAVFGNVNRYNYDRTDHGLAAPSTVSGVMERELRSIANIRLSELRPGSYIAIVETAPHMSLGLASVEEEASFHVVRGSW